MLIEVDPVEVRFTQDSIAVHFKSPYDNTRLDYAVDMIVSGKWSASKFPPIDVVSYETEIWSLDNRRLWVFRHAKLKSITVDMKNSSNHPRFLALIDNQELLNEMNCESFLPRVRGKWRLEETIFNDHRPATRTPRHAPEASSFGKTNSTRKPTFVHNDPAKVIADGECNTIAAPVEAFNIKRWRLEETILRLIEAALWGAC